MRQRHTTDERTDKEEAVVTKRGYIIGQLVDGARFVANTPEGDADTYTLLTAGRIEPIGLSGRVSPGPDGRNIFQFN